MILSIRVPLSYTFGHDDHNWLRPLLDRQAGPRRSKSGARKARRSGGTHLHRSWPDRDQPRAARPRPGARRRPSLSNPQPSKMNDVILLARHGPVASSSRGRFSRDEFLTRKNALLFLVAVEQPAHGNPRLSPHSLIVRHAAPDDADAHKRVELPRLATTQLPSATCVTTSHRTSHRLDFHPPDKTTSRTHPPRQSRGISSGL